MKGYAYILNGKPVASETEKPQKNWKQDLSWYSYDRHDKELKHWEQSCMEIQNAFVSDVIPNHIVVHYEDDAYPVNPGQPIEIEKTDKGCIVTKIL